LGEIRGHLPAGPSRLPPGFPRFGFVDHQAATDR
jgi:hypothetical protein